MTYLYSATGNTFYPEEDLHLYQSLPDDLVNVEDSVFEEFSVFTNGDLIRVGGEDGMPAWGERPPLTVDEIRTLRDIKIRNANLQVGEKQWQGKAVLGLLSDKDKAKYIEWINYIDDLSDVEPENFTAWPVEPS